MPNPLQLRITVPLDQLTPYLSRIEASLRGQGKRNVLGAIGYQFWRISRENLGARGVARPHEWAELSKKYIQWLKRKFPQGPFIPTLLRTGTLLNSIMLRVDNNVAEVFTDCAYAGVHQFGYKDIPERPYFPITRDGELTPYAERKMREAANAEMATILKSP